MSLSAVAAAASGCVKGCTCPVGDVILALASPLLAFVHKVEKEEVFGHCWSPLGLFLNCSHSTHLNLPGACSRTEITHRFLMLAIHKFPNKGQRKHHCILNICFFAHEEKERYRKVKANVLKSSSA